jgi:hypothetical protein
MRYLNKIENVQTFELGLRFAYSSGKGTIYVDGEEVDFPESLTFIY